jgi:hypothetical protein
MNTNNDDAIEVYIIAYNNLFCVEYQIKTFRAFCKDNYRLIVIDSNCGEHPENSKSKKKICDDNNVEYISLPNHLSMIGQWSSLVLGYKLNYVYNNIVLKRNPKYFAFIDQDFFPFTEFTLKEFLDKNGAYGDVMEANGRGSKSINELNNSPWVIHPWLSFYRLDFLKDFNMNWLPCSDFDTGGSNWESFFSKKGINKKTYWLRDKTILYFPWESVSDNGPLGYENEYFKWNGNQIYGQVQIYDNKFIHVLNSRFLDDPFNPKTNWCKGFLDAGLLSHGLIKSKY